MTEGWGYGGSRRAAEGGGKDRRQGNGDQRHSREKSRRNGRRDIRARERSRSRRSRSRSRRARSSRDKRRGGTDGYDRKEKARSGGEARNARNALTYRESSRGGSGGRRAAEKGGRRSSSRDRRKGGSIQGSPQSLSEGAAHKIAAATDVVEVDEEDDSEYTSGSYEETESSKVAGADVEPVKPKEKPKDGKKDDIVHFDWQKGMALTSRYRVIRLLGDGTFGRVLLVDDQKKDRQLAIKVIRNVEKYVRNAKREAEILKDIREADPKRSAGCCRMHDIFWHETEGTERFFCMSFEVLGASLYDLLKQNRYRGLWVQDIQSIARQSLEALAFLHDELNLTHTDLKLENVLFQSPEHPRPAEFPREAAYQQMHRGSSSAKSSSHQYVRPACTKVKLIDFGNATYELEHHSSIINTRQYRAPEVILAMGWNERSDLWSVGCILMELYTGELLFRTHESLEHLALMERAVTKFPPNMLGGAGQARREQFLVQDDSDANLWRLHWPEKASSATSEKHVKQQRPLQQLATDTHRSLADFVASLLILEPSRRPSAKAALAHPFLFERFTD